MRGAALCLLTGLASMADGGRSFAGKIAVWPGTAPARLFDSASEQVLGEQGRDTNLEEAYEEDRVAANSGRVSGGDVDGGQRCAGVEFDARAFQGNDQRLYVVQFGG